MDDRGFAPTGFAYWFQACCSAAASSITWGRHSAMTSMCAISMMSARISSKRANAASVALTAASEVAGWNSSSIQARTLGSA